MTRTGIGTDETGETVPSDEETPSQRVAQRTGRLNAATGVRRLHLAALDAAIVAKPCGLSSALVVHGERAPVLRAHWVDKPGRLVAETPPWVEVGCASIGGRWWFLREDTGEGLVPVDEVESAPPVLLRILSGGAGQ